MITTINEFKESIQNKFKSDAIGYNVGEYLYHITPKMNINEIKQNGFIPKNGVSINGKSFTNRLYFATSLIAAYDLSVNFNSYKNDENYVIFKLKSTFLKNYKKDKLFNHGIFIDYPVSYEYVIDIIDANNLFNKFDDEDLENLY